MIFREVAQNIRNLYSVVDTGIEFNKDSSSFTITADGSSDIDYVQLNIDGIVFSIRVPHHPSIVYKPGPSFPVFG